MNKLMNFTLTLCLVFFMSIGFSQSNTKHDKRIDKLLEMVNAEMELTDEQMIEFNNLTEVYRSEVELLMTDENLSRKGKRAKTKEAWGTFNDSFENMLDAKQLESWHVIQKRTREEMKNRRMKRGMEKDMRKMSIEGERE